MSPVVRPEEADRSTNVAYPFEFSAMSRICRGESVGSPVSTMSFTVAGIEARFTGTVLETSGFVKSPVADAWTVMRVTASPHPASVKASEMAGATWLELTVAVKVGPGTGVAKGTMAEAPPTPRLFVAVACT